METAEDLVMRISATLARGAGGSDGVAILEQDRAAVALAITRDVLAIYLSRSDISWESIEKDLAAISAKYAAKAGGGT